MALGVALGVDARALEVVVVGVVGVRRGGVGLTGEACVVWGVGALLLCFVAAAAAGGDAFFDTAAVVVPMPAALLALVCSYGARTVLVGGVSIARCA